jgi:hypothetical protein
LTVPQAIRNLIGVSEKAKYFAYLHPPAALAEIIDWGGLDFSSRGPDLGNLDKVNDWAVPYFAMLGGFVYFSDNCVVQVNSLSLIETKYSLNLAGPFKVSKEVKEEMREMNRVHPCTSDVLYENSFFAYGCTIPGEVFRSKSVIEENNKGLHGAFLFYR